MTSNEIKTIAQRLREYIRNPHHVDPVSDAFKSLISEAANLLSAIGGKDPTDIQHLREELGTLRWIGADEGWDLAINAVRERIKELSDDAAIPASAEPSAPVERDERVAFEAAWSARIERLRIRERGNEFYRVQPNDLYRWNNVQDAWELWQARAALERK